MTPRIRSLIAVAVTLVACGGTPGPGGDDGDAAGADSTAGDDGGGPHAGVACGLAPTLTCALPAQACCDLPPPSTDLCYAVQGGICEGGSAMRCDGPEDCMTGEVCCFFGGGASCTESPTCVPGGGRVMCHDGAATGCPTGESCCDLGPGPTASPYAACMAVCPQ